VGDYKQTMLFKPVTIQEANAYLPFVKEKLIKVQKLVIKGQVLQQHLDDRKTTKISRLRADGQEEIELLDFSSAREKVLAIEQTIRDELVKLHGLGIVVKSIVPGRICFFAERHRQPVFLSWQAGEKEVSYWHALDDGFSMRQIVQQPEAFGPHYIH